MEPIRIIQTGDFHLDSAFTSGRFTPEQAIQRRRDLRETFSAVMDLARTRKVQILLVTGDVFEHHHATIKTIRFIRDHWAAQPDLRVLVTPGNHDPAVSDSLYHHIPWSANVHIFTEGCLERLHLPELNLDVYGYGWTTWEKKESFLQGIRVDDPGRYNLLMFHGEVDGQSGSPYCPVPLAEIAASGFNGAAVGHIHLQQSHLWQGSTLARYAGSPEPLHFAEKGRHGVLYGEISLDQERWESVPLARREYQTVRIDPQCLVSQQRFAECLQESNIGLGNHLLLRVDVEGPRNPEDEGDIEELIYWLNGQCFLGEIRDFSYPDYDLEALAKEYEDTVLADFIQNMRSRIHGADGDQLPVLRKALQYGLDALTGKRGGFR